MISRTLWIPESSQGHHEGLQYVDSGVLAKSHLVWLAGILRATPASFEVRLHQSTSAELRLEWQSVFEGAGVGYLSVDGGLAAVCVVLDDRFPSVRKAVLDAVLGCVSCLQTPAGRRAVTALRSPAIARVRGVFLTGSLREDVIADIQYWADALALVYLGDTKTLPCQCGPELARIG